METRETETPMSSATVIVMTEGEVRARRAEVLKKSGMKEEDFHRRARDWSLDARELALYDEMRNLDFLLEQYDA